MSVLPEWNDLPHECREALCTAAGWHTEDWEAGQCALDIYIKLRETLPPQRFPLFESRDGLNGQARNPAGLPDSSGDLASAGGIAGDDIKDHRRQVGTPRELVERLRATAADATSFDGKVMKEWDAIRAKCLTHKGSDLPRLMFEALIEGLAEQMIEAADALTRSSEHSAAADVLERVAAANCSDPATDDLTVPLAIKLAETEHAWRVEGTARYDLELKFARAMAALKQIHVVCEDNAGPEVKHDLALRFVASVAWEIVGGNRAPVSGSTEGE